MWSRRNGVTAFPTSSGANRDELGCWSLRRSQLSREGWSPFEDIVGMEDVGVEDEGVASDDERLNAAILISGLKREWGWWWGERRRPYYSFTVVQPDGVLE